MVSFGLKCGQDLENRVAQLYQEFLEDPSTSKSYNLSDMTESLTFRLTLSARPVVEINTVKLQTIKCATIN